MFKLASYTQKMVAASLASQFASLRSSNALWPRKLSCDQHCRLLSSLLAAFLLCSVAPSHAEPDDSDKEKDAPESAVKLPAAPLPDNLLPFASGPNASQSFSIDAKSLSISPDGIVRYTLVAQSPSGAQNISHEGLRCQSLEVKFYAFGHKDGSWSPPRHERWQAISFRAMNRPQAVLAQDYFCRGSAVAGKAEDLLERIRNKRPLVQ